MTQNIQTIQSKADLQEFIRLDLKARDFSRLPLLYQLRKPIMYYTVLLRKTEYLHNTQRNALQRLQLRISALRLKRLGAKLGFSISLNVFGPGLYIVHWGSIVISSKARIGANARVHSCVNVTGTPVIGDNVYLGPGAVVVGDITLGNDVSVGANAVVTTSFLDKVVLLGSPARVVQKTD